MGSYKQLFSHRTKRQPDQTGTEHYASCGQVAKEKRPVWKDIAPRFLSPSDCFASYLALEAAEVIAGVKPANLVAIPNSLMPCGRNPYTLWKTWGREVLASSSLQAFELKDRESAFLVMFYHHPALQQLLARPAVRTLLRNAGYLSTLDCESVLGELALRMDRDTFPHEVGIFLGYPLKDVVGFMGLARIPFTCQGPWKIYGDPSQSLNLANAYRCCRRRMAEQLEESDSPFACLRHDQYESVFLPHLIENGCHFLDMKSEC